MLAPVTLTRRDPKHDAGSGHPTNSMVLRWNACFYTDDGGHRRKVSTRSRHKAQALAFLRQFRQDDLQRRDRFKRLTLSEFEAEYLAYSKGTHRPSTYRCTRTALHEFRKAVGELQLHKVGPREIEQFLAKKREEASEVTARTYFVTLASAFGTALRWGNIPSNPFRSVKKPRAPEIQPIYLTTEQFGQLLSVVQDPDTRDLYVTAVSTGMRLGELLALRWEDVDFPRAVVMVCNHDGFTTKSGRCRAVPMADHLQRVLDERRSRQLNESSLVFNSKGHPLSAIRVSKSFKANVRQAGLPERVHFHSLRHTFASLLPTDFEYCDLYERGQRGNDPQ